MAKCEQCGKENRAGALFCRSCGKAIAEAPVISTPEAEAAPETEAGAAQTRPIGRVTAPVSVDLAENTAPQLPGEEPSAQSEKPVDPAPAEIPVEIEPEQPAGEQAEKPLLSAAEDLSQGDEIVPTLQLSFDLGGEASADEAAQETKKTPVEAGTVLQGRYHILQLLSDDEEGRLYEAEDDRRCWSCQAIQTEPEERFCEACGAELTQKQVVQLRARPIEDVLQLPETAEDCFREQGVLYQVEVPSAKEGVEGMPTRLRLVCGFDTNVGQERSINEDSLVALQLDGLCMSQNMPVLGFFAVADGMGGHETGEIASRVAIHTLAAQIMQYVYTAELGGNLVPMDMLAIQLKDAVLAANQAILDLRDATLGGSNMGCTLTATLMRGASVLIANVGDSRTYWMHDGRLTQVTRDHSMAARLIEQNMLKPEEIYAYEQKGVIYRSLGDNTELVVETDTIELAVGDRLLLCSDGLWDMVRDSFIEDVMLENPDPQQACERLVELANLAGGMDNISVIVVDVRSPV